MFYPIELLSDVEWEECYDGEEETVYEKEYTLFRGSC